MDAEARTIIDVQRVEDVTTCAIAEDAPTLDDEQSPLCILSHLT